MNPEERVKLVIDLVAEEILRQMRKMEAEAEAEAEARKPLAQITKRVPVSNNK